MSSNRARYLLANHDAVLNFAGERGVLHDLSAMALLGIVTLLAGVVIALRSKSLGPLIVIPGVLGIAMVVLLAAIFYPLKRESR